MNAEQAVKEYQCSGCTNGPYEECFSIDNKSLACKNHTAGTSIFPQYEKIFLGMPKGFNKIGKNSKIDPEIQIFKTFEQKIDFNWEYDFLNIPVWKYLDKFGNTIIRGYSPRINEGFIHIILEDCIDKIDCFEITEKELLKID